MFCVLVVGVGLFEFRAGEAVADCLREFAKIEAFAGGIERAEQALHALAEVLRADEERLGAFGVLCMELDQADGGTRRETGEEIFVVGCVEILAAVEVEHGRRILRRMEEVDSRQLKVEREEKSDL